MGITSDVIEETPYEDIIEPTCPSCRQEVPWGTEVCPHCGYHFKGMTVVEEAPKAVKTKRRKGKTGTVIAASSIVIMGILTLLSLEYFPILALGTILVIILLVVMAAAPE